MNEMPPAMILCGGKGTRLRDVSEIMPKPMVPVGGRPIVWHIMKTYAAFGVKRFILCLGYKSEAFVDYFLNYRSRNADLTVRLKQPNDVTYHSFGDAEDWEVTLVNTGDETLTGGRVARAVHYLKPADKDFFLTYGDGVANVDLRGLYEHHCLVKPRITVTAVHPPGRFGEMRVDGSHVTGFHEKPQTEEGLINGGYMVLDRSFVSNYLTEDEKLTLEQEPMRQAAAEKQMSAFVHHGFWQCMDNQREHQLLNTLWSTGSAPWKESWK